ncbi:MAG: hypothetical protein AB7P03_19715 [Kofleriaceae bacterium]
MTIVSTILEASPFTLTSLLVAGCLLGPSTAHDQEIAAARAQQQEREQQQAREQQLLEQQRVEQQQRVQLAAKRETVKQQRLGEQRYACDDAYTKLKAIFAEWKNEPSASSTEAALITQWRINNGDSHSKSVMKFRYRAELAKDGKVCKVTVTEDEITFDGTERSHRDATWELELFKAMDPEAAAAFEKELDEMKL